MKIRVSAVLLGIMFGLACGSANAADSQTSLTAQAKIDKQHATRIALAKAPGGNVTSAELEREHGHLVWSFDISKPHSRDITEVQVDAVNGKIVSVVNETPAKQAAEALADKPKK